MIWKVAFDIVSESSYFIGSYWFHKRNSNLKFAQVGSQKGIASNIIALGKFFPSWPSHNYWLKKNKTPNVLWALRKYSSRMCIFHSSVSENKGMKWTSRERKRYKGLVPNLSSSHANNIKSKMQSRTLHYILTGIRISSGTKRLLESIGPKINILTWLNYIFNQLVSPM